MEEFDPSSIGAVAVETETFDPSSIGAVPIDEDFDPISIGAQPVETDQEDTLGDDWSGFVANMKIAGNRLGQGIDIARVEQVSGWKNEADEAKRYVDILESKDPNVDVRDVAPLFGSLGGAQLYSLEKAREKYLQGEESSFYENALKTARNRFEGAKKTFEEGAATIPEYVESIAQKEKRIEELSPQLSPEMQQLNRSEGSEFWKTFASNPVESIANVIASSAVVGAPGIALGAIGSIAGPAGTAAGSAYGSFITETSQSMLDSLRESGVDLTNPEKTQAALGDPIIMQKARQIAESRGVAVATFDALTAGLAGKFIGPVLKETAPATFAVVKASGKELAMQMAGGATGELVAQGAAAQEISGKEIGLEALGEIGSGVTETISNLKQSGAPLTAQALQTETKGGETDEQNETQRLPDSTGTQQAGDAQRETERGGEILPTPGVQVPESTVQPSGEGSPRTDVPNREEVLTTEGEVPAPAPVPTQSEVPQQQESPTPQEQKKVLTPDDRATALQPFLKAAQAAAQASGATDPEDAAQVAWIKVSNSEKPLDNPRAVLIDAARSEAKNQLSKANAQKRGGGLVEGMDVADLESQAVQTRGPRAEAVSKEDMEGIAKAIETLNENERRVAMVRARGEEMTAAEVAEELDLAEGTVRNIDMKLKELLKPYAKTMGFGQSLGPGAASAAEVLTQYEVRRFSERFQKSKDIDEDVKEQTGNRYYEVLPNEVTAQKAREFFEQNPDTGKAISLVMEEKQGVSFADRAAIGQLLVKKINEERKAIKETDPEKADRLLDRVIEASEWLAEYGTRLGQGVQAFAMWNRLTPEGKLRSLQREIQKARRKHKAQNKPKVEQIISALNEASKESASKVSKSAKVRIAAQKAVEEGAIWDRYTKEFASRMASLLPGAPPRAKGPLEKFADDVLRLFREKSPKTDTPKSTKPQSIVRVRQMISEWPKLKEAWKQAWSELSKTNNEAAKQYAEKAVNYLDAPFTEGDVRSMMRDIPLFSVDRIGKLDGESATKAIDELVSVVFDEMPSVEGRKEVESKIREYASKIVKDEVDARSKAEAEIKAAREAKPTSVSRPSALSRSVWGEYEKSAIKNLETALFGGKSKSTPALQEFTSRLVSALRSKLPKKEGTSTKLSDEQVVREAVTNFEKYKQVWQDTANAMKLRYGSQPDVLLKLDEIFGPAFKEPFSRQTIRNLISKNLKEDDVKLSELIEKHYSNTEGASRDLAEKISASIGVPKEQADLIASAVEQEFASMVTKEKASALAKLVKTNPVAKKAKSGFEKLIAASNKGALNDQTFYDAVSESLGLPAYTKESAAEIMRLAEIAENAPEGMPKEDALNELNSYIARIKGFQWSDLPLGIYYGNILSGVPTQVVNLVDTALNVINESAALAATDPKAATEIMRGLARGIETGRFDSLLALTKGRRISDGKMVETPFLMDVAEFGKEGGVPIQTTGPISSLARKAAESKGAKYLNAYKYVGRAMAASDSVLFRSAQEAKAAQLAYRMANTLKGEELRAEVDRILGFDRAQEFLSQAEAEGYTGATARARATELMILSRPEELQKEAADFASEATYNYKPYGFAGAVSNSIETLSRKYPALKLIVPFTRIVANVFNRGINNTPYGAFRALRGKSGDKEFNDAERRMLNARATIGTMALSAVAALEIAGVITLHGQGPPEEEKRKQLRQTGWKPYSIQIGDKYYTYTYTPIGLGLAAYANFLDSAKYKTFSEKDNITRLAYAMQSVGSTLFSQSFLSGLSSLFEMLSSRPATAMSAAKRFASSTTSGLAVPFASLLKDINQAFDPSVRDADSITEAMISDIPIARTSIKPAINALGEPIMKDRFRLRERFYSKQKEGPWKTVRELNLRVPTTGPFFENPDQDYEYAKKTGERIKGYLERNEEMLRSVPQKVAQDSLENFSDRVKKEVRGSMLYQGAKKKPK